MTQQSVQRLNFFLERFDNPRYLEVGVFKGITFSEIRAHRKVAVDPKFHFDVPPPSPDTEFHEVPSDIYFANVARESVFDVIFLDGLHTFEQTYRDFCNAVLHVHPGSIIVIDDTIPSDPYSAIRDQRLAVTTREKHGGKGRAWHGDTYKTVLAIHDFFPSFSYATVMDDGNPQSVVWRQSRNTNPAFERFEQIGQVDYFEFLNKLPLFNPVTNAELIRLFQERGEVQA